MIVREVTRDDFPAWAAMRRSLWPDDDPADIERELTEVFELDPPYTVFVADDGGMLIGFIELWQRSYAEGGPSETSAYVEGLWVDADYRRQGVARALLDASEEWARSKGFAWLGSDAVVGNEISRDWHLASGFREIETLVVFGKPLSYVTALHLGPSKRYQGGEKGDGDASAAPGRRNEPGVRTRRRGQDRWF